MSLVVSDWLRTPAPFNLKKHGWRAIFSGDKSVVERREPEKYVGGCVCYTSRPLPPGQVWEITILNTISRSGGGMGIGVTTTLPDNVLSYLRVADAGPDQWYYFGQSLYHNRKGTTFHHLPYLNELRTQQRVGIQITENGELNIFIDGNYKKTVATGLPVHQAIFGVVDVCGKCTKFKSEILSALSYTHHVLDDRFPGICFLGKPHEVTVQSDPVTISPPGHGVSLKIPPNAIQSSDKPVNVSLQTCLSSSVFQYPEGCTPLSAVYHISSDMAFDKDVELTFEHFAELETDKQANEMTFLRAEAQGEGKYIFVPMGSGEFKVGGHKCTISTRQFSFVSAGSISSSEIRKRYTVLFSYSNEIEAIRHAAVAISLDDAVYLTNFRTALEEEWKVPLSHRCKLNVSFIDASACVEYDPTNLRGWNVISHTLPCTLSQEDVDYSNATTLTHYDYPPRVIFEISPSENAEPSTLQFKVTGITKPIDFQVPLRKISQVTEGKTVNVQSSNDTSYTTDPQSSTDTVYTCTTESQCSISTTETQSSTVTTHTTDSEKENKPNLLTLMNLSTSEGDIKIIQKSAKYYRGVGIILLNDRYGERVDVFEQDTRLQSEAIVLKIYKEWLAEDPNCSWMTLTDCFRQCGADRLAYSIEQHFGLTSPQRNPEDSSSLDSEPVSHDQMSDPVSHDQMSDPVSHDQMSDPVSHDQMSSPSVTSDSDTEAVEELSVNTRDEGMLWSRKELVATVAIPITAIILFFLYKYLK